MRRPNVWFVGRCGMTTVISRQIILILTAVLVFTAACSSAVPTKSSTSASDKSPSGEAAFSEPSELDCQPPSPEIGPSEVAGFGIWALVFAPMPLKVAKNTKIVWRMGGHGSFNIGFRATDGTTARITFGPEYHPSSSWDIPNTEEWGTNVTFPKAGCWRVHAWRDNSAGDLYFLVGTS
jgi:hypothetical protein